MPTIIFGLLILALALWVLGVISRVDPKVAARVLKAAGGTLAIGFAVFLGLRGEIGVALPLGVFGLGLLGWIPFGLPGFSQRTKKSAGQTSRVRSAFLEMELDHDSGEMRGRIVAGSHQRRGAGSARRQDAWPACSTSSTKKAARYWWLILTAGMPAGVNTRKVTRQRGGLRRGAEK